MRNEVIFDDRGIPDILVVFTPDELKLPDTLKGRKVKEYAISKYPNTMIDGRPYSLPFMPLAVNVNHDEAIRLCEAKGPGWHLITNDEWAALARQSWENDTVPTGNTNSGKSHSHPEQKGTTYQNSYGKTLAGSGPIGWNHDRTAEGVADMVGNVWEHVGGVRFLNGQVQIIPNNEAAAGADQSPDSKEWTAIYTPDGGSGLLQRKRRRDRAAANRSRGEGLRRRAVLRSSRACRHGRTGQADRARPLSCARL